MMKKTLVIICVIFLASCKKEVKSTHTSKSSITEEKVAYPSEISRIFDAHGRLSSWKKLHTLSFNKGEEVHTVDLKSRKTVINTPKYSLGFNGKDVWLHETENNSFKSNKDFYYNLYFYFYAMPFVLADDGITYEKVDDLVFEGNHYPGFKISYALNVGTSPDDNYIVYYNPKTHQMEWLAYTVTFNSKKKSDDYHLIKYDVWENVDGILLPKEIVWFTTNAKGNPIKPSKKPVKFSLPLISTEKLDAAFFEKPVK
ncbi:DUF6503 family protein [Polaribacter tangerinus]|uniref:DUF6503 family protein n=1 Tax=Polaribacter tangerinus TaxID=1920034 RepID=UPI001E55305A|nr:DUF6503 family protein [Polaribacter tangerinus]